MGRPNWIRILAYSTDHVEAPSGPRRPARRPGPPRPGRASWTGRPGPAVGADQPGGRVGELEPGLLAGLVHGGDSGVRVRPSASPFTANRRDPGRRCGRPPGSDRRCGRRARTSCGRSSVQPSPDAAGRQGDRRPRPTGPMSSVRASVAMVSPEAMPGRRSFLAPSSPEVSRALAASATVEKYGAHSRARAHLLEHHDQLDVGEAGPAELLGDGQALQAELLGHLASRPPGRSPRWSPSAGGPRSRGTCPRGSGGPTCAARPAPR